MGNEILESINIENKGIQWRVWVCGFFLEIWQVSSGIGGHSALSL